MSDNPTTMMRSTSGFMLALALVLLGPAPASAEDDAGRAEASERFNRGIELFDEEEFEAALAEFLRAYELAPNFVVLLNIGHTYRRLSRNPQAVDAFERYLEEGGASVESGRRAEVEGELERLRRLVGRIDVVTRPASATIYLDDTEAGQTPLERPLTVSAGQHVIEVRAEGFLTLRREVTVAGEAEVSLELSLSPSQAAPAVEPDAGEPLESEPEPVEIDVAPPLPQPSPSSRRRRSMRTISYVMFGTAAAALGAALGLFVWNNGRHGDWESEDDALSADFLQLGTSDQSGADALLRRLDENEELGASIAAVDIADWVVLGVGLAALGVALGLFFGAPDADEPLARVSLLPGPGGGLLRLSF